MLMAGHKIYQETTTPSGSVPGVEVVTLLHSLALRGNMTQGLLIATADVRWALGLVVIAMFHL